MGRVGADDEPDRSRTCSSTERGVLSCPDHGRMQTQPQVGVRVHPDELAISLTFEQETRTMLSCGPDHPPNNGFPPLGSLLPLEPCYVTVEHI